MSERDGTAARVTGHLWKYDGARGAAWYAKVRDRSGRQRNEKIGPAWTSKGRTPAGHFTKKSAQEWLDARLTALRNEAVPPPGASGVTFKQACDEWLRYVEHDRQRAASTIRDYRNAVSCYLLEEFGPTTPLIEIDSDRIDAYRDRLLAEGEVSRRTAQKVLVLLHGVLKRAVRKKWLTSNPAENVEKITLTRSGDFNVLKPVEVEALARAAHDEQEAAIYVVAAFTGLRLGELRALRWGDVDFAGRRVHVRRNLPTSGSEREPKSGKVRSVPLADQPARALESLSRRQDFISDDDRVFCNATGGTIGEGVARKSFYAALDRAQLGNLRLKAKPIRFHDLRHTFGTLAVQKFPLTDVKVMMGHANVDTTMIYVHHVPRHDDADRLSSLIAETESVEAAIRRDCLERDA